MRSLTLALLLLALCLPKAPAGLPVGTRYVMSHFKNDGGGGDERLYISLSPDGLNWTALNGGNPVFQPPGWTPFGNVVRDPSIIFANGFYWVAYTSGTYGHHTAGSGVAGSFGLVKSADLLQWASVGEINTVTPGATDPLTWSPTFFRDGDGTVHVYVAIRPDGGSSFSPVPGMRVHELHPLNADWTQWSVPVLVDLPSTNTNELWVWKEGEVYHGLFVDFTRGGSPYVHVTSSGPVTGWGQPQVLGFNSQEGGFALKRPDGGYRFYSEAGNAGGATTYLYADADAGFAQFTPQQAVVSSVGMRNGKAIAAPDGTSYAAWSAQKLASVPAAMSAAAADPDQDGRSNVVEFATGGDPLHFGEVGPLAWDDGYLRYTRGNGAEASLVLEVSTDLQTWLSGPAYTRELSVTLHSDGTEEVVAAETGALTGPHHFYRLRATTSLAAPIAPRAAQTRARRVAASAPRVVMRRPAALPPRLLRRPQPRFQFTWVEYLFFASRERF